MTDPGQGPDFSQATAGTGIFYGWWLALIGGAVTVIGTVPLLHALSMWSVVLSHNFGWTTSQLAWSLTLSRLQAAVLDPVSGWAVQKLGPRLMIILGLVCVGAGFLLFSRMANLWTFYLAFGVASLGAAICFRLPVFALLNNWFRRRRATAMSIPMIVVGAGSAIIIPTMVWSIGWDSDAGSTLPGRLGWRNTALVIGLIGLGAAGSLGILIRNRPEDYGQHPDGIQPAPGSAPAPDYTLREAWRTRSFWVIAAGYAGSSIGSTVVMYQGLLMLEQGLPLVLLATATVVQTGTATVFMLLGGIVGDRVRIRLAISAFSLVQCVAVGLLTVATTPTMFILCAFLQGVGQGGRAPLTDAIHGAYFGRRSCPTILGIAVLPGGIVVGVLPGLLGWMRSGFGGWTVPLAALALFGAAGSVAFLFLRDPQPAPSQIELEIRDQTDD